MSVQGFVGGSVSKHTSAVSNPSQQLVYSLQPHKAVASIYSGTWSDTPFIASSLPHPSAHCLGEGIRTPVKMKLTRTVLLSILYMLLECSFTMLNAAVTSRNSDKRLTQHYSHTLQRRQNSTLLDLSYYNKPGKLTFELLCTRYKRWQNLARSNPQVRSDASLLLATECD